MAITHEERELVDLTGYAWNEHHDAYADDLEHR